MKNALTKLLPYMSAVLLFAVLSCIYMAPELNGKIIAANDNLSWQASVNECQQYTEQTGKYSFWTGSMFSGMPNYQIGGGQTAAQKWLKPFYVVSHWGQNHSAIAKVFIYLIGFFILLIAFGVNPWLAIAGSIAMAMSTYFFIIIGAAHNSKTATIGLMAAVIGGCYMIYHGRMMLGAAITMIFVACGFYSHPQMSYYICFIIGALMLAELIDGALAKQMKRFCLATLVFAASFIVGFGTGTTATLANMEYASQTMRGGHSDLVKESDEQNKTKGLDLDYATSWSYGIDETMTLLIPNYMGGSSHYNAGDKSTLYKELRKQGVDNRTAKDICHQAPTYWGTQPFTAGPVYVGAIVCLLFILGLIIVDGAHKWALLAVTLLAIALSWGHNAMWLTKLFFDSVPMYNKFRAVSSILVIAEITMPLLGMLAIKKIMDAKGRNSIEVSSLLAKYSKYILIAGGVTCAICLATLIAAGALSFTSPNDVQLTQYYPQWLMDAIIEQRHDMFVADCWRSLLFAALTTALLYGYVKFDKVTNGIFVGIFGVLVLADLWPVNKRYMNDDNFSSANSEKNYFRIQPYEEQILRDKDPHYRVINLATNTFNDARTSYRLKSVGGYHAAKLRRYQDIIDRHLSQMHLPVYNMLNTKYFIVPDREHGNAPVVQQNPDAMGNAWFVSAMIEARGANEEIDKLNEIDLRRYAVIDTVFSKYAQQDYASPLYTQTPANDSIETDKQGVIRLTNYAPDAIEYHADSQQGGTAVFSEIYYPFGWNAYIDGKPAEHFRVNYILRALNIPAGAHDIRFEFRPESVKKGDAISLTFIIIMYIALIIMTSYGIYIKVKKPNRNLKN
ncbi:MAG TPA: hypothetical protein DEO38_05870 [Bacteroidales bacterium]|nr:hypothetical protein [Bacteroidales bacterium]